MAERKKELEEMEQQKYKGQVIQVEILQPSGTGHWTRFPPRIPSNPPPWVVG
jgi:hypothetical protein